MKPVLKGATDAGSMILFDPAALPEDFDQRFRRDAFEVLEALHEAGTIYWLNTDSDGDYNLGVCVESDLPNELAAFAKPDGVVGCFAAPSGRLHFTGVEYAYRYEDAFLCKHEHMGSCLDISPGAYHLTVFELHYPEDFEEGLLRERLSSLQIRIYTWVDNLVPLGCLGVIALSLSIPLIGRRLGGGMALLFGGLCFLSAWVLTQLRPYREAKQVQQAIEQTYPAYCAVLKKR